MASKPFSTPTLRVYLVCLQGGVDDLQRMKHCSMCIYVCLILIAIPTPSSLTSAITCQYLSHHLVLCISANAYEVRVVDQGCGWVGGWEGGREKGRNEGRKRRRKKGGEEEGAEEEGGAEEEEGAEEEGGSGGGGVREEERERGRRRKKGGRRR